MIPTELRDLLKVLRLWRIKDWNRYVETQEHPDGTVTTVDPDADEKNEVWWPEADRITQDIPAKAQAVSSEIATGSGKGKHVVALDIDVPAYLVPSSTPGHSHLYIDLDEPVTWKQYRPLLKALTDCGVIGKGYYQMALVRQATFLRLPWVKKGHEDDDTIDLGDTDQLLAWLDDDRAGTVVGTQFHDPIDPESGPNHMDAPEQGCALPPLQGPAQREAWMDTVPDWWSGDTYDLFPDYWTPPVHGPERPPVPDYLTVEPPL